MGREKAGAERQMLKQKETCSGRERTRWLRVSDSYICVLIDVIILVLNTRLWDKPERRTERHRKHQTDNTRH